ncbi:MAG: phosphotransferase [Eubacterium sp.]
MIEDFENETIDPDGFSDINELYLFFINNKPDNDLVFTHGDYCLPNIFIDNNKTVGFLDLGKAGIADRWQDIALCVRSLKYNMCNQCSMSYDEFINTKKYFYSLLGIKEDKQKLKYYILLDELF